MAATQTNAENRTALRDNQLAMARYLRNPEEEPAPAGIEPRRLKIYEDLVYNNIESFLTSGFPMLYSRYDAGDWRQLVRNFMQQHRCHSPYFLEISQEFLNYLLDGHIARPCDPPFMSELAHYEWVELALDVSEEEIPESAPVPSILEAVPRLSPLAWPLAYQYPVHRIGSDTEVGEPEGPTYLVVYRDTADKVRFMEVNAATARLLELVRENDSATVRDLLHKLATEMNVEPGSIEAFGCEQVQEFAEAAILWFAGHSTPAPA